MPKQTVVQVFRDTATDEQWQEMVEDHKDMTDAQFKEKYGFSWSAIRNNAAEKGFYEKIEKPVQAAKAKEDEEDGPAEFLIRALPDEEASVKKSILLYESTAQRLAELEHAYRQYTKTSIINKILSEALEKYGY